MNPLKLFLKSKLFYWNTKRPKRKNSILLRAVIFLFFGMMIPCCTAQDFSFDASVDRNQASIGDAVELSFNFSGVSRMPAPETPTIEGFQVRYLGPSTRLSMVNGQVEQSVTHRYLLVPLKEGVFRLGPFTITHKGTVYTSQEIKLTITQGSASQNLPSSSMQNTSEGLNDKIFLQLEAEKTKVYLNEAIPLTVTLYARGIAVRDIQYPEFSTPGFTVDVFDPPLQFRQTLNGKVYEAIQFKTKLFAARTGDFTLGPAHIKCNLLIRRANGGRSSSFDSFFDQGFLNNFFGAYENMPMDLKSSVVSLTVLPFPQENKPKDFNGAVGDFVFMATASPKEVNVGDPITIKMVVKGDGNFNAVSCPKLEETEGFKVYEPQMKQGEGERVFEQIVLPRNETIYEIPVISFSFFNPRLNKYETLLKGPFPIKVNATGEEKKSVFVEPAQASLKQEEPEEVLGKDIVFIKTALGNLKRQNSYLYKSFSFWFVNGMSLMVFLAIALWASRNEKLRTNIAYARRLQAPRRAKKCLSEAQKFLKNGNIKDFYDAVFKLLREYLGDKFQLTCAAITGEVIQEKLKQNNVSSDILEKLNSLFNDCDMIRYAPAVFDERKMKSSFEDLRACLMYLEKNRI